MSGRAAFEAALSVSRETTDRLEIYAALLEKWNPAINLVAKSTISALWTRHFLDSAQVFELGAPGARLWADIGTGGGFPGLIVAILAQELRPGLKVICIESDQRKATFLRTVVRETGISAEVIAKRIEEVEPLGADVISARALAPLPDLLRFAGRHLRDGGEAIFLKGAGYRGEVSESLETWSFRMDTYPSKTDPDATILTIGDIHRV
ncbi:16S rRNA (guanine(527)-N(7))-methyltransferase RsmG [Sinisalibacter aestuarii]|uniref:Ribosomal RNA small subunit methyltransferase G n=1 Tax=Sinisalibacter aestuarii TaxID=2949426 RepID=A0ABQ5LNC0_9RHOB|nr:16S rRNA (guanine(527)-N(7))-methyltransferase RsmG [Sinisalibacter aestuarii]GKY86453.1 ribosomal RNA small subunit methyltransferase G [Sinisalibacter aestuarii]